jgi:hypothetical protein
MKMTQHFTLLGFLSSLSLRLIPAVLGARDRQIEVEQILRTTQSWDGINYKAEWNDISRPNTPLCQLKFTLVYLDADADLLDLQNKVCGVIGFGSQRHAHALNLKDSGIEVIVGLYQGSKSISIAQGYGFRVLDVAEAA